MNSLPTRLRRMMPQQVASDDLDEWAAHIETLEQKNKAQLAELKAISKALGTNEGHSSIYWIDQLKQERDDLFSRGQRLALELECLLLDTKDTAVQSKWWDSAHEALEEWRK